MNAPPEPPPAAKWPAIALLCVCEVATLALWFSATAVVPSITAEYPLTPTQISLFTSMVQGGFVAGTLISAALGLADRLDPRRYLMAAALIAAAANAVLLIAEPGSPATFAARFVTGMCMAGVYPVGMKMAASWARGDLGLLVAILVGSLALGSGSPHLINAVGCVAGGWIADRWGRTALTIGAMAISGSCAVLAGFAFGGAPWLLTAICLVWGISVVADSPQFSASVTELAPPELTGTMLTVQTCAGFLLTLVTIHLMPLFVDLVGWRFAFAPLALGPLFGVWAMARLRGHPDAVRLAGGRR